jgi:hypothetical protein
MTIVYQGTVYNLHYTLYTIHYVRPCYRLTTKINLYEVKCSIIE